MGKIINRIGAFKRDLFLAWFLASSQIKRSSRATTLLIILIMSLTFLNLIVVRGILVGLLQGLTNSYHYDYAGDVILTNKTDEDYITHTSEILQTLDSLPQVKTYSYRYSAGAVLESGYQARADFN